MKIFLSWSMDRARVIADAFRGWLPLMFQKAKPYMSPEMDKGSIWFSEIVGKIKDSDVGLIFLTPDNLQRPWVLWEAGALSIQFGERLCCPILFGLEPKHLTGSPLSNIMTTTFDEDDVFRLMKTLNTTLGDDELSHDQLTQTFGLVWPLLETKVTEALATPAEAGASRHEPSSEDMLSELLTRVRGMERVVGHLSTVNRPPFLSHAFDAGAYQSTAFQGEDQRVLRLGPGHPGSTRVSATFPVNFRFAPDVDSEEGEHDSHNK